MRIAVTGTPGTGKTTATERLDVDLPVLHLNEVVHEEGLIEGRDEERDTAMSPSSWTTSLRCSTGRSAFRRSVAVVLPVPGVPVTATRTLSPPPDGPS